jgi:hypothetical protein
MSMSGVQSGPDENFGFISREKSVVYSDQLDTLAAQVRDVYDVPELVDFLALTQIEDISGGTYPLHGLVGIDPELFDKPEHALFVGVHEAVHAKLGDAAVTRSIDPAAPGLRAYFHSVLVPAWLNGEVDFRENQHYILDNNFAGLVPDGWHGWSDLTPETADGTVANYFSMTARGLVMPDDYLGFIHPTTSFTSHWQEALAFPVIEASKLAEYQGIQVLADVAITGFQMGHRLRSQTTSRTMWAWEEGVANSIASGLTGLSLDDAQRDMYQDEFKMDIAHRLVQAGLTGSKLAEQVQSRQDLEALVQEFKR